jgi:hypothetical protein
MKNPTHNAVFLFTRISGKTISFKTQLSMISEDFDAGKLARFLQNSKAGKFDVSIQAFMCGYLQQRVEIGIRK